MHWKARLLIAALVLAFMSESSPASAGDPSPEYRSQLRRTAELRKQRRRGAANAPVGVIEAHPTPPVLIIRHTAETHAEIEAFLNLLRRGR
jgi:hypothetical protein